MSSLTLMEIRVTSREGADPDALFVAEWFKAPEGFKQYRATSRAVARTGEAPLWAPTGTRYFDTAAEAVRAAQRAAARYYREQWARP